MTLANVVIDTEKLKAWLNAYLEYPRKARFIKNPTDSEIEAVDDYHRFTTDVFTMMLDNIVNQSENQEILTILHNADKYVERTIQIMRDK